MSKYVRLPDLLIDLEMSRNEGTYKKVMAKYANPLLLIIDEWLLLKPNDNEQKDIFELLHRIRKKSSTIFCSHRKKDGMKSLVEHLALGLMQSWIELYMMHIRLTSKALTHQKMYQCLRYTAWIKAYASKLALGGFQCSGLSVPDFPELQFHRTRIFSYQV